MFNIHVCVLSHIQLFATPWTVAHQALCPWDSSQEYWSGLLLPHFLLQVVFLTQGSNPHVLLGRWVLYNRATREAINVL